MNKHCPPLEQISVYINHQLPEGKRGFITDHLSTCTDCYQLYSETIRTQESLSQSILAQKFKTFTSCFKASEKKFWQYTIPLVAAASFAFFYWAQLVPPTPLPGARQSVHLLTLKNTPSSLLELTFEQENSSPAFKSRHTRRQEAVKLGVRLIDLEIALEASDPAQVADYLRIINKVLEQFETDRFLIEQNEKVVRQIQEEKSFQKLNGMSIKIESSFRDRPEERYLEFGKWVESHRLAALTKNADFFENQIGVRFFKTYINDESIPPRVQEIMEQLATFKISDTTEDHEFQRLSFLLREMQELMVQ
ncbi:MAG: hypothetical protein HQM14_19200 [SAR324 cluster bacterium]|nr:hypothetical protein [SAR324 cluster bacterium]